MKIVITGGNGYIGSRLSLYLSEKGHQVTAICYPEIPFKKGWNNKIFQTIVGDITQKKTIEEVSKIGADVIIHLVSLDHFESEKNPDFVSKINVQPTWNLLDICTKNGLKKFIYFSTIHVYGKNQNGIITEKQHPTPYNAYGLTHYLSEEICNTYNRRSNTSCINIRLSNSYGEPVFSDANCWDLVVNNLCLSAVNSGRIVLKGNGAPIRDFVNYQLICESIEQILQIESIREPNTFHLSSGESISMLETAFLVQKVYKEKYGKTICVYKNNDELVEKNNETNNFKGVISNDRLKSLINFDNIALEIGIDQVLNFLENNKMELTNA
jgi:UDP-glucose 4-epimerase